MIRSSSFVAALFLIAALSVATAQSGNSAAQPSGLPEILSEPSRTEIVSAVYQDSTYHRRKFENDRFVESRSSVANGGVGASLFDITGRLERELRVSIPGATESSISDGAITSEGRIIFGVSSHHGDKFDSYLAEPDKSDVIRPVLRVYPFVPLRVCAAEDGIIWAYGWERSAEDPGREKMVYPSLRAFDLSQGQVFATVGNTERFSMILGRVPEETVLACSGNQVTLFFGQGGMLFQVDTRTRKLSKSQAPALEYNGIRGFAVRPSGELLALFFKDGRPSIYRWHTLGVMSDPKRGIEKAEWILYVDEPTDVLDHTMLLGASGFSKLVFYRWSQGFAEWRSIRLRPK